MGNEPPSMGCVLHFIELPKAAEIMLPILLECIVNLLIN